MRKKAKKHVSTASKSKARMFSSMRVIIVGSSVVALLVAFVFINKNTVKQSVQGVSIVKGMYNEGMVSWQPVAGAVAYNIYYGSATDITSPTGAKGIKFTNSVRQIPASATNYTIQYLKKNTTYKYMISAVGLDIHGNKTETWFSPISTITSVRGM